MTQAQLRLRLVVRRNALPETKVVFPVSLEAEPTVAKLLEQVNDVLPLESDDWGLEDYAVELRSADGSNFECLHFQPLESVFKEDDQVFIRPLLTDDLRRRRIGGRDQVSNHGKHLFDGVPFGRPLLKAPKGRPKLRIPPRKRPRLLDYPSEEAEEDETDDLSDLEEDAPRLLLTQGEERNGNHKRVRVDASDDIINAARGFDDEDELDPDYEAEDERMTAMSDAMAEEEDQEEAEDMAQELQDLRNDQVELDSLDLLHTAFPTAPKDACKRILEVSNGDLRGSYQTLLEGFKPAIPESALLRMSRDPACASSIARSRRQEPAFKVQHSQDPAPVANGDVDDGVEESDHQEDGVTEFQRQFDKRGLPPGSISLEKSGKGLKAMAELMSKLGPSNVKGGSFTTSATLTASQQQPDSAEKAIEGDTTSSSGTSSDSEDEEEEEEDDAEDTDYNNDGSSSESSDGDAAGSGAPGSSNADQQPDQSGDSDSDSGPEETSARGDADGSVSKQRSRPTNTADTSSEDPSSSSSESSDSDSDSDDTSSSEESSEGESSHAESSQQSKNQKISTIQNQRSRILASSVPVATEAPRLPPSAPSAQPAVPPGSGTTATRKRNARRRAAKKAKMLAERGESPEPHQSATPDAASTPITSAKEAFEAKRKALLEAIANGGVEVGPGSQLGIEDESTMSEHSTKRKRGDVSTHQTDSQQMQDTPVAEDNNTPTSSAKRRRIDLGAGRRMLFGALGLRNPKTKDDEDKLRAKLMRGVKPLANARIEEDAANEKAPEAPQADDNRPESATEDAQDWREKIIYRAVECCQEGVELSEPPFPFVQRWDPQQQGGWYNKQNKRGGRGKRAERNQAHFYQEDSRYGKKRKHDESVEYEEDHYDDSYFGAEEDTAADDVVLNYDEEDLGRDDAMHAAGADQDTSDDDLPLLPDDLNTLPPLHIEEAEKGMVITWTKMVMSRATKWQPQMCNFTGKIVEFVGIDDDAAIIEVVLAKRDRHLDWNEKQYDEVTGERILGGFEVDDPEENPEEERKKAEGYRTLNFAEMGSPRILHLVIMPDQTDDDAAVRAVEKHVEQPHADNNAVANDADFQGFDDDASPVQQDLDTNGASFIAAETTSNGIQPANTNDQSAPVSDTEAHFERPGLDAADPSKDDSSEVSSPSRQLHDETTHSIDPSLNKDSSMVGASDGAPVANETDNDVVSAADPSNHDDNQTPIASEQGKDITDAAHTSYPRLDVPRVPLSSAGSAHSGRQPDYSMDMDIDVPDSLAVTTDDGEPNCESVLLSPESPPPEEGVHTPTAVKQDAMQGSLSIKESPKEKENHDATTPCSLDSLNTVWCTAATSRHTESPSKSQVLSAVKSQKSQVSTAKDAEYEEAMRKLDDQSDDDMRNASQIPDSFEPAAKDDTQSHSSPFVAPSDDVDAADDEAGTHGAPKISPPLMSRAKTQVALANSAPLPQKELALKSVGSRRSSQFSIPPGTQVVEISSDESEDPVHTEDYADDDVDEDYDPSSSSLPEGPGWVIKNKPSRASTAPLASRGKAKKSGRSRLGAPRPPLSLRSESAAAVYNRLKKRLRNSSGRLAL